MKVFNPAHRDIVMRVIDLSPFLNQLGVRALELEQGVYRSRLEVTRECLNSFGGIHGGVYAALLDSACYYCAYADVPEGKGCITMDLQTNYLRSAKEGDTLTVEAHPVKVGRTVILTEGTVYDDEGRIMAHATSKLFVNDALQPISAALDMLGIEPPMPPKFIEVEEG